MQNPYSVVLSADLYSRVTAVLLEHDRALFHELSTQVLASPGELFEAEQTRVRYQLLQTADGRRVLEHLSRPILNPDPVTPDPSAPVVAAAS